MNALVLAFFAVVAIAASAPPPSSPAKPQEEPIAIVKQESDANPDGSYRSSFEAANGITQVEEGSVITGQDQKDVQVAKGFFTYTAPDGTPVKTEWYADETGFHAKGDHLPVEPEVPVYIARALEWASAHPYHPDEEKLVEAKKIA